MKTILNQRCFDNMIFYFAVLSEGKFEANYFYIVANIDLNYLYFIILNMY